MGSEGKHVPTERKRLVISGIIILSCAVAVYFLISAPEKPASSAQRTEVIPAAIRESISFPLYYPDPNKLPSGYTLDRNSFSSNVEAVLYSVSYDTGKKIAFTTQNKPKDDELKVFHANQLPLRNEVKVPAGIAVIGVLNDQTFVSLPTDSQAWLLITAPKDIDPAQLKQILHAIVRD